MRIGLTKSKPQDGKGTHRKSSSLIWFEILSTQTACHGGEKACSKLSWIVIVTNAASAAAAGPAVVLES